MTSFFLLVAAQAAASTTPAPVVRHVLRRPSLPVVAGPGTCLPMKLSNGLPVVTATLQGRKMTLAFDTGSPGGPHIDPAIIEQLKLTQIGEVRLTDPSQKNIQSVGLYEVHDLKLGGLSIANWNVSGRPARPDATTAEPDGVFGLDAFNGYVVTIDYPGGRITATPGRLPEPDGKTSFRYQGPIPQVPLSIEGHQLDAHVDTGNSRYALIVPESYAAQLGGYGSRFPIGIARTINNKYDLMALPVRDAKVGDLPLYAGTAAYPGASAHGNLGSPLLRDMVIKVDPANAIVSLTRAAPGLESGCSNA